MIFAAVLAVAGEWHVNANGYRLSFSIAQQGEKYIGYLDDGGDCMRRLDSVTFDGSTLEFRRTLGDVTQWYRVTVDDGVMVGRFCHLGGVSAAKPGLAAYQYHVTGWNEAAFDPVAPVAYDINANGYRARIRIDRQGEGFIGQLKVYAYKNTLGEGSEEEITVTNWDGEHIEFRRGGQVYTGDVSGREIAGKFTHEGLEYQWSGTRAELLTYGIAPKSDEYRNAWQARNRRILSRLMVAGNPQPLSTNVEILATDQPPISGSLYPLRDDDPAAHPQNYTLTEFRLTYTLPNWLGGAPIQRTVHGYFARPNGVGPFPLAVAVNGHGGSEYGGSAYSVMDGGTHFWYGDAFARRGYAVLAVDISHRPMIDRIAFGTPLDLSTFLGVGGGNELGDDPAHGNPAHPSIKPDGYGPLYTDWEEDGERAWDVMRAIDYAVSRSDVDPSRIVITGLSMGGEVASYVAALDTRIKVAIPAGYSPDLSVIKYHENHHCWNWAFSDIREYIDQSDVLALIAPRPLIVETGAVDNTFSDFNPPYVSDQQVVARARVAYGAGPLFHYLHPLAHEWQGGVVADGQTVFDLVAEYLGGAQ